MVHLSWGNEDNLKTFLGKLDSYPEKNNQSGIILAKMAKKLERAARGEGFVSDEETNIDIDAQIDNLNTSFGQEF